MRVDTVLSGNKMKFAGWVLFISKKKELLCVISFRRLGLAYCYGGQLSARTQIVSLPPSSFGWRC